MDVEVWQSTQGKSFDRVVDFGELQKKAWQLKATKFCPDAAALASAPSEQRSYSTRP